MAHSCRPNAVFFTLWSLYLLSSLLVSSLLLSYLDLRAMCARMASIIRYRCCPQSIIPDSSNSPRPMSMHSHGTHSFHDSGQLSGSWHSFAQNELRERAKLIYERWKRLLSVSLVFYMTQIVVMDLSMAIDKGSRRQRTALYSYGSGLFPLPTAVCLFGLELSRLKLTFVASPLEVSEKTLRKYMIAITFAVLTYCLRFLFARSLLGRWLKKGAANALQLSCFVVSLSIGLCTLIAPTVQLNSRLIQLSAEAQQMSDQSTHIGIGLGGSGTPASVDDDHLYGRKPRIDSENRYGVSLDSPMQNNSNPNSSTHRTVSLRNDLSNGDSAAGMERPRLSAVCVDSNTPFDESEEGPSEEPHSSGADTTRADGRRSGITHTTPLPSVSRSSVLGLIRQQSVSDMNEHSRKFLRLVARQSVLSFWNAMSVLCLVSSALCWRLSSSGFGSALHPCLDGPMFGLYYGFNAIGVLGISVCRVYLDRRTHDAEYHRCCHCCHRWVLKSSVLMARMAASRGNSV